MEELVKPIPVFLRPMAKKKIKAIILDGVTGELVSKDDVVKGYIIASPGNMQERAIKLLKAKGIDLSPFETLLQQAK